MAGDLERGVGELKKFQKRVNELLSVFEGGAGGKSKVSAQGVPRSSFSGPGKFDEAEGFSKQYDRVHTSLIALSKSLGDQIELLSIGVHAADVGYDNVEDDLRHRFHTIQTRLDQQREAQEKQQKQEKQEKGAAPAAPSHDSTSGMKDLG